MKGDIADIMTGLQKFMVRALMEDLNIGGWGAVTLFSLHLNGG